MQISRNANLRKNPRRDYEYTSFILMKFAAKDSAERHDSTRLMRSEIACDVLIP